MVESPFRSTVSADFNNRIKYPTVVGSGGTVIGLVSSTSNVLRQFNWTQVGFLYTDIDSRESEHVPFCKHYAKSFQDSIGTYLANITTYIKFVANDSVAGFQSTLSLIRTRARIIITCLENREDRQTLMKAASLNRMLGGDYVYMFIQASASGFGKHFEALNTRLI
jgi:hypothetical protein